MGESQEWVEEMTESCFRVCTRETRQRKQPGDVLLTFVTKRARDAILQKNFEDNLVAAGQKVDIFREIPFKLRIRRQRYRFLTTALRRADIKYKWEYPEGSLIYIYEKEI